MIVSHAEPLVAVKAHVVSWQARLSAHRAPLVTVGGVLLLAQAVLLFQQRTFVDLFYDSGNYLAVAHHMVAGAGIFNHLRTPLYPGFLALFLTLDLPHPIATAVLVQMLLYGAGVCEAYVLAWRLTGQRWGAAAIATLLAGNLYMLQWERTINSEGITLWLLITLFLVLERALHAPERRRWVWLLGGLLVAVVLTRPFFVYLPLLVLGGMLVQAWRSGRFAAQWRQLALVSVLIAGVLGGY
ncbi:MAG: hypothetical protein H0X24_08715, partial [Ktedonobacterales bacterium]|nr:hypothetical protein [Ktedonobacterales bacterium]